MLLKNLLALLLTLFLSSGVLHAQEVKPPATSNKGKEVSLKNLYEKITDYNPLKACTHCDLVETRYFAEVDGMFFKLSADQPLPFPKKWIKKSSITQKLSGYEVTITVKERKKRKVLQLILAKRN